MGIAAEIGFALRDGRRVGGLAEFKREHVIDAMSLIVGWHVRKIVAKGNLAPLHEINDSVAEEVASFVGFCLDEADRASEATASIFDKATDSWTGPKLKVYSLRELMEADFSKEAKS